MKEVDGERVRGRSGKVGEVSELGLKTRKLGFDQRPFSFEIVDVLDLLRKGNQKMIRKRNWVVVFWYFHGGSDGLFPPFAFL